MSWKMIGSPKTRKLTRGLADEYANMTPAPHDRPLNATRMAVLKAAFDLKKFRTCEWASVYCKATKQTYRVNGKHTSTLLSSMNGELPADLHIIVEAYEAETMEDVAALYTTFDTRSSARSTGDINCIFAAVCPELETVSRMIINLSVTGMAYAKWEDSDTHQAPEERAKLLLEYTEFVLWLAQILPNDTSTKHLQRGAVVAAMFRTWTRAKAAATDFWGKVKDETDPSPQSASRKLGKYLLTSRLQHRGQMSVKVKPASRREMFVKCIHGWNAERTGETTALQYFAASKVPACK